MTLYRVALGEAQAEIATKTEELVQISMLAAVHGGIGATVLEQVRALIVQENTQLAEAQKALKRNTKSSSMVAPGWTAIPTEDFTALRTALASIEERLGGKKESRALMGGDLLCEDGMHYVVDGRCTACGGSR